MLRQHLTQLSRHILPSQLSPKKNGINIDHKITSTHVHTLGNLVDVYFGSTKYMFDSFWLRDNCPSQVHNVSLQRLSSISSIPLNIRPHSVSVKDGNLLIVWPDDHVSIYPPDWLLQHASRELFEIHPPNSESSVLWSGMTWSGLNAIPVKVSYKDLIEHADERVRISTLKNMLKDLYIYGFALVEGTPPTPECTRRVAESIGHLRNTIFGGDFWDYVIDSNNSGEQLQFSDTAYTTMEIKPHTDGSYHYDPPGIQVFHCLDHEGTGGVNTLVDGWFIANQIQKHYPSVYDYLTSTPIDFYYTEDKYSFHTLAPAIQLDSNQVITALRFNNHDRNSPHPFRPDLQMYHKSVQILEQYIENPDNNIEIKLEPGVVLMTYGWRVLHGRTAFTGRRRMVGCYIDIDEFISKFRVLSRLPGTIIPLQ